MQRTQQAVPSVPGTAQRTDRKCGALKRTSQGLKTTVNDRNRATDRDSGDR